MTAVAQQTSSSTTAGTPPPSALNPSSTPSDPLARYSLSGRSSELEAQLVAQRPALGRIALTGQATVIYAPPNTGKTLLTLHLLTESISRGHIDPEKVYYLNMDDTASGLVEKLKIAEDYGFHMIAEGHRNFSGASFVEQLQELVESQHPKGMVLIVDTLKKVADLMSKKDTTEFTRAVRKFVLQGGTLIGLAHTNKNRNPNGKLVHAGTSDLVDDFDCVYMIDVVPPTDATPVKTVVLSNMKRRGSVPDTAAFSYSTAFGVPYPHLLASVCEMDETDLTKLRAEVAEADDAAVIAAIASSIQDGITQKMRLAEAAGRRTGIGRNKVVTVLDRYCGTDPLVHRWWFLVGARGSMSYSLHETAASTTEEISPASPDLKPRTPCNHVTPANPPIIGANGEVF